MFIYECRADRRVVVARHRGDHRERRAHRRRLATRSRRRLRHAALRLRRGDACARDVERRRAPSTTASPSRRSRSSVARWPDWPLKRASASTSRPAANSTSCCAPVCRPDASSCTATTSRPTNSNARSPSASIDWSWTTSKRSPLLSTLVSASAPLDCLVRVTPGVEAHTHEFVRTGQEDTKFGFSVATGDARQAIDELRAIPGLTLHGVHAHIGSQVFELFGFVETLHDPGEVHRRRRLRRTLHRRRVRRAPTSPGRRRRRSTSGATRFASPPTRSDSTPTCDCSPNRAAPSSPRRRVTLYEVGR